MLYYCSHRGVKHKKNYVHFVEKNQQKNQLKSQEKIKNQKNLVRLFFNCFTPRQPLAFDIKQNPILNKPIINLPLNEQMIICLSFITGL